MNKRTMVMAVAIVVSAVSALPALGADDAALMKDLTAVIALHGLPCGQVVAVKVQAENDYAASCQDANKYHVYLNAAGRVVVEKK
jgi:hypothetical protein